MINKIELQPGLALHLTPSILKAEGATCSLEHESYAVDGDHYFVCVGNEGDNGSWIPVFSGAGEGRHELRCSDKLGHPGWTRRASYYHSKQVWHAPHDAIIEASRAARDRSEQGRRNRITQDALDILRQHLEARA